VLKLNNAVQIVQEEEEDAHLDL